MNPNLHSMSIHFDKCTIMFWNSIFLRTVT